MNRSVPQEVIETTCRTWRRRAEEQEFKFATMKYRRAEVEFFCGAMSGWQALGYELPLIIVISIGSGLSPSQEILI